MIMKKVHAFVFLILFLSFHGIAQVAYDAVAAYGLRKIIPAYTGGAVQVIRTCDNATATIGFTSCGHLDTVALKTFVIAAYPFSQVTATAATAYSLRKVRCSYSGFAVRVRSSAAGSPTLDVGFTARGDLDTMALKAFVGANSAFVAIWYDQSGNLRHATQAAAGSQPRLMNAGVIDRQGIMPAVRFLGMGSSMSTAAFTTYTAAACFNAVARVSTNLTYNTIVNKTTSNYPAPLDLYNSQMVIGSGPSYNFFGYGQTFNASLPLSVWTYEASSGGPYNFYYNGSTTGTGSVGFYGDGGNPLVLGSRADGVTGLNGWISECLTFDVLPSATDRKFIEWTQSQYYGVNGFSLGTLPVSPASASITVWYDQSGTGKNAVQAAAAGQPRFINAGILEKNGQVPAISFAGNPQNLVAPLSAAAYPLSISVQGNTSGAASGGAFAKLGTSVNGTQGGIGIGIGQSGGTYDNSGTSVIALKEWVAWSPSNPNLNYPATPFLATLVQQSGAGGTSVFLNGAGVPVSNASSAVGASLAGNLYIGGYVNSANRFAVVKESEVIVLPEALSATRRRLLESQQATYHGIAISNGKYTPPAANAYHLYMNGVGREGAADSVGGTRSTTGMGFIIGQAGTDFLKDDGDYLTCAMNCPVASVSTLNLPGTVVERWANDWYLNKTDVGGNNGTINFFFDFSDYGFANTVGVAGNYELLVRNTSSGTFSIVAGTTRSVAGDRVMFGVDASGIFTNCYYTLGTRNSSSSPLPVEMVAMDAACSGDSSVIVNWTTAVQIRNDHFSVERSLNGTDIEVIGTVQGAGTHYGKISYSFTDRYPYPAAYYRIAQSDDDGTEKPYKWMNAGCGNSSRTIRMYPNPTSGLVKIESVQPGSLVRIYNSLGGLVYEEKITASAAIIDLGHLPEGLYILAPESPQGISYRLMIFR